jgi:hypothetical protein
VEAERVAAHSGREWQIEDTWRVAGMKGTGSQHIALTEHFVSGSFVYEMPPPKPCVTGEYFDAMGPFISLSHAALALGIAEAARETVLRW